MMNQKGASSGVSGSAPRYRNTSIGGCIDAVIENKADNIQILRSTEKLLPYPKTLLERFEQGVQTFPNRTLIAQRERLDNGQLGDWRKLSYAQVAEYAKIIGQGLLNRQLNENKPLVILAENSIEHFLMIFGAMWVGVPFCSVSPAYALVAKDFAKLKHIIQTLTPGLVFCAGAEYEAAVTEALDAHTEVIVAQGDFTTKAYTAFSELLRTEVTAQVEQAHQTIGPDHIVKFLFTSGSTKEPKAVINTHKMICSNQQMLAQSLVFLTETPPVLVDWLPWNHTFGGNHNIGIVVYNGGTMYIDEGKPTSHGIKETLRNLREISPTVYFNVPKGFEEIAAALEYDVQLRQTLLKNIKAFFYSGASLSQPVWDRLDYWAEQTVQERIPMMTGLGMTETAPSCTFALKGGIESGHIGLPCPGVEVKLVPDNDPQYGKTEIRFRGPNVMPGYWRAPEQTAEVFDEEGFYCTGDAVKFVDPQNVSRGLRFDGRLAEDFKLSSGTFVNVGALRAKIAKLGAPYVQDSVVAGLNEDDIGILIFPRLDSCRELAALEANASIDKVLKHPKVVDFFQGLLQTLWDTGTGSASRVARAIVLQEPPSIDRAEMTDKGSINQRAVLVHRAASVKALYKPADYPDYHVLRPTLKG